MAAEDTFPTSYKDPLYARLDAQHEQKLGLPIGSLSSVRANGERTNHGQVSSAGAITPYQFTPATRKAILSKYGIDVTLSPQNASEGAGLLLKEGLDRNQGDLAAAVGEYVGGIDRKEWGNTTKAYINRVMAGQRQSKESALDNAFSKWMQDNPATGARPSAAAPAAPAQPQADDPMAKAFADWIGARTAVDRIPKENPNVVNSPPSPDPTLGQSIVGAGEAGLNAITGATGGALGMLGGTLKGLAEQILSGQFGTPQAADLVEKSAMQGAQALTYQPRTPTGQEYAQNVGDAMGQLVPIMPLAGELSALHVAGAPVRAVVGDTARAAPQVIRNAAAPVIDRVNAAIGREPSAPSEPTPGTLTSGGSAAADMALQRRANAESLPVPIELTKGQAERAYEQQRFERETAKDPAVGAPLRERYADQNDKLLRNFDVMVDQTGGEAPSLRAVGASVDKALVEQAARDKAQIRVAYKEADKAGELATPVSLSNVVDYLNNNAPDAATAPLLDAARKWVVKLGIAKDEGGQLVATGSDKPMFSTLTNAPAPFDGVTLKTAETLRQAINRSTDFEPTNVRQATILKQLIDQATDGKGGDLYQQARALRARFAQNYENRANIAKIINNKRGMADRQVALEDVFNHTILNSSLDDVRNLRRLLQRDGGDGAQAWRDLQGQTMQWIKDQATKNVATDIRGNRIVSADALERALKTLDHDGKLDFVFGKKGAQTIRDLNDLVKVVHTSPPGSVNTSNTASVLLAALTEAGVTGGLTGLPVPVLTGLKALSSHMKQRRLQAKVQEALGNRPKQQSKTSLKVVPKSTPSGKPVH